MIVIITDLTESLIHLNLKYPNPLNLTLNNTDKLKIRSVNEIKTLEKKV
jgi:hypothetical protein